MQGRITYRYEENSLEVESLCECSEDVVRLIEDLAYYQKRLRSKEDKKDDVRNIQESILEANS